MFYIYRGAILLTKGERFIAVNIAEWAIQGDQSLWMINRYLLALCSRSKSIASASPVSRAIERGVCPSSMLA